MSDPAVERADHTLGRCIEACAEAHDVCTEAVSEYLQGAEGHGLFLQVRLLLDCAALCATTRDLLLRSSDLHRQTAALCAEACERCAEGAERAGGDAMARVSAACRRCAEACRDTAEPPAVAAGP